MDPAFETNEIEISPEELASAKGRGRKALLDVLMVRVGLVGDRRERADALLPGVLAALTAGGQTPRPLDQQVDVLTVPDARERAHLGVRADEYEVGRVEDVRPV